MRIDLRWPLITATNQPGVLDSSNHKVTIALNDTILPDCSPALNFTPKDNSTLVPRFVPKKSNDIYAKYVAFFFRNEQVFSPIPSQMLQVSSHFDRDRPKRSGAIDTYAFSIITTISRVKIGTKQHIHGISLLCVHRQLTFTYCNSTLAPERVEYLSSRYCVDSIFIIGAHLLTVAIAK